MAIRILFVSGWAANNGLSRSTVHPHLAQLATYNSVEKVAYLSIESGPCATYGEPSGKIEHFPIEVHSYPKGLAIRARDYFHVKERVLGLAGELRPDIVICRGAQAGALGYSIWKKHATPYYVESFEPHAEYMAESGVWRRYGIKYLVQKNWEQKIKQTAAGLITVSSRYARYLVNNERIPEDRVKTVPCWVDREKFRYNAAARKQLRERRGLNHSIICVYLGQFGGLYYEEEAYHSFSVLRDAFSQPMHFLLLTPADTDAVSSAMHQHGFGESDYSLLYVDHADIPGYLSAADFAISFHRQIPAAYAFSPIKYGEYWSCGLPVIAPEGVGDDAEWIEESGLGRIVDFTDDESLRRAAGDVTALLEEPGHRELIRRAGLKKRSREQLVAVYDDIINGQ